MISLVLLTAVSFAQSFDEQRMDRDLKIAENVIATLAGGDSRMSFYDRNIEGTYIPDFGVMFSVPRNTLIYTSRRGGTYSYSTGQSSVVIVDSDEKEERVRASTIESKEDMEKMSEEAGKVMKENITTFLVDYADLIGQLKPSDRIVVQSKGKNELYFREKNSLSKLSEGISAQILKSDLIDYKQGKLSREKVIEKIEWTEYTNTEVAKDIELFSTIFSRLYEPDLSNTYYSASRRVNFTRLENFGVTFRMKFYSSSSDDGLHTIRTTGESGLSQEERNEKVNAMYPAFEESFKENLLDYGRTIKSLSEDEMLIFKAEMTECRGCEMPEEIEVTVKAKTLKDFDAGKLTRDKALAQINIKKKRD